MFISTYFTSFASLKLFRIITVISFPSNPLKKNNLKKTHQVDQMQNNVNDEIPLKKQGDISMGTTLLAIKCKEGIVCISDSRTSSGALYVHSKATNKITQVGKNIFVMRTGSAADTQYLARLASNHLDNPFAPKTHSAKVVSHLLSEIVFMHKEHLSAGFIVVGYDDEYGPQIYSHDVSGGVVEKNMASHGSGSIYTMAYLDKFFREDMTMDEATALGVESVNLSMIRDGASGGVINVVKIFRDHHERYVIRPDGQQLSIDNIKS